MKCRLQMGSWNYLKIEVRFFLVELKFISVETGLSNLQKPLTLKEILACSNALISRTTFELCLSQ